MQITQQYTRPSFAQQDAKGMGFNFSAESSRPNVSLNALIKNSLGYARVMLALRKVVTNDERTKEKDHTAYQEWVMGEYIKELPDQLKNLEVRKAQLLQRREVLKQQQSKIKKEIAPLQKKVNDARYKYYQWLYKHDREKWVVLDPVISVHEDAVIFEAFSLDESSYGRVSVPTQLLEIFDDVKFGTTNIDFSQNLANELGRVRSYRPAWLKVAFEQVALSTDIGENVEKKIDLPPSWVQGFLQVQSASTLEGTNITLNSQTLSQVLGEIARRREKSSPRSIRFVLEKGKPQKLVIDPWGIEVMDDNIYQGDFEGEIRIWGRRRLQVFSELLPYTDKVQVKLLGTGMPSYWSVEVEGHRFDVGLSGWTANDWAKKGNFDLLASAKTKSSADLDLDKVYKQIMQHLKLTPAKLSELMNISLMDATFALQTLVKNGQAMYDHILQIYRWRQLLSQEIKITPTEQDERLKYATELVGENKVTCTQQLPMENNITEYSFEVQGKNLFTPKIQIDAESRIKFANCNCAYHRKNGIKQGACMHIMAGVILLNK